MKKEKVEIKVSFCHYGNKGGYFWRALGDEGEISNSIFLNDEVFATEKEAIANAKKWADDNNYKIV